MTVFYPMIDTILLQLDSRFEGTKAVIDAYRVVQPYFLVTSTKVKLLDKADKCGQRFSAHVSPLFESQLLSVRSVFRSKLDHLTDVKQLARLLWI